jgi:protein phosphatase
MQEIAAVLACRDVRAATDDLVRLALEHGGRDNVSVVTVLATSPGHDEHTAINPALA